MLKGDHGPMAGVGMSQTGLVHQGRFLQSYTKNHKVPFSDLFLPLSLLQSHHLSGCRTPRSQSSFQGAVQLHRLCVVAKSSTVRTVVHEPKISYASTCYNY